MGHRTKRTDISTKDCVSFKQGEQAGSRIFFLTSKMKAQKNFYKQDIVVCMERM